MANRLSQVMQTHPNVGLLKLVDSKSVVVQLLTQL